MNLKSWVDWGNKILECFDNLPEKMQEAYSFILDYKELLIELKTVVSAIEYIETVCKTEGLSLETSKRCKTYIIRHVIGNANNRRAMLGFEILEYLKEHEAKLNGSYESRNISSDIIESTFGIFKQKKSPNNCMALLFLSCLYRYTQNLRTNLLSKHLISKSAYVMLN